MNAVARLVGVVMFASSGLALPLLAVKTARPPGPPRTAPADLPASLAELYPPATPGPLYLERMLALGSSLSGLAADLLEGDVANARAGYTRLKSTYGAVARLVPEWEPRFPRGPLDALGLALEEGDVGRSMGAIAEIGQACHACHLEAMVPAQQAYRWRSFEDVTCEDGTTGVTLDYAQLMRDLDLGLAGVVADAEQGQVPASAAYLRLFRERFEQLAQSCLACHPGRRDYYVDPTVRAQVDELGDLLERDPPDTAAIRSVAASIGEKSCGRCHMVHLPAAMAHAGRRR